MIKESMFWPMTFECPKSNYSSQRDVGPQLNIKSRRFGFLPHLYRPFPPNLRLDTSPNPKSLLLDRLSGASKLPNHTRATAGRTLSVPVIRVNGRHGGARLDRLVGGPLDDGGDLWHLPDVDVVVHARQLQVVVGGVGRVGGDVEGLAADGVEDVGVCDPDGRPRRRALDGAVGVAQLGDVLGRGRREWRPGDELVAVGVAKGS